MPPTAAIRMAEVCRNRTDRSAIGRPAGFEVPDGHQPACTSAASCSCNLSPIPATPYLYASGQFANRPGLRCDDSRSRDDCSTAGPRAATDPPMQASRPRWSHDGKKIAFAGNVPTKRGQIFRVSGRRAGTDDSGRFGQHLPQLDSRMSKASSPSFECESATAGLSPS